jgi:hypothetical protein
VLLEQGKYHSSGKVAKGREHLIGVICMIILEHKFKGQLYKDVLDFTTSNMHIMHVMLTLMSLKKYLCTMAFGGLH